MEAKDLIIGIAVGIFLANLMTELFKFMIPRK